MSAQNPPTPTEDEDAAFAMRLRAAREERGFTQGVVANRTKMIDDEGRGVSRTAIIAYEQGTTKPGIRELRLLCEVLHVTPNKLIYGTDSAAKASLASMELFDTSAPTIRDVLSLSLAMLSLKGHERDALLTLALSLAGRQLGDSRLSSLVLWSWMLGKPVFAYLKQEFAKDLEKMTLEELANFMADEGAITNAGNRFRHDEDGEILNPEAATYQTPSKPKSRKSRQ